MKNNKIKLIATAMLLGIPISSVLIQDNEANAALKVTTNAFKGVKNKAPLVKPMVPPKPKFPSTNMINKNSGSFNNINGNINTQKLNPGLSKPSFVGDKHTISSNSISKKVSELNIGAASPNQIKLNLKSFSQGNVPVDEQKLTTSISKKLNINSAFKNKLNSILNNGSTPIKPKPSNNNVGKLNIDNGTAQKLGGVFGSNSQISENKLQPTTIPTSNNNLNNNIPPAPPLPTGKTPLIPDAPPLPTGKTPTIPDAPPLPSNKPQANHILTNKISNNKLTPKESFERPGIKPQKPNNSQGYDNVLGELQAKLSKRK